MPFKTMSTDVVLMNMYVIHVDIYIYYSDLRWLRFDNELQMMMMMMNSILSYRAIQALITVLLPAGHVQ